MDEQAAVAVSQHGVAAIEQRGIFGLGARDKIRDHGGVVGRAEIAGQDHRGGIDRAAFLDAAQEGGDEFSIEHPAADGFVARPVAQQRGRHGYDVDPVHLHRKYRGAVADMAVSNLRLYRNHVHEIGLGII